MNFRPDAVVIEPSSTHIASVIWLHGLGADGHDFEPIVPELGLPEYHGIRFIFPHAPKRPVTINGGMVMRAWYDVRTPDLTQLEDEASIRQSGKLIDEYINDEIKKGIPSNKILLAGFSQGGAIILYTGLRSPLRFAGLLSLSAYLPLIDKLQSEATSANLETSIMVMHGTFDPVIPVFQGQASRDKLINSGYPVIWKEYPMQHAVCAQQISDISHWLQQQIGNNN